MESQFIRLCLFLLASTAWMLGLSACSTSLVSKKETATFVPTWTATPSPSNYYINSVAISGDGQRVLGGTFFHQYGRVPGQAAGTDPSSGVFGTYCYNAAGNLAWKDEFNGWQGVYWVDVSTDGAWAASGGWYSQSPMNGFARAYNAATGAIVLDYRTAARVNQVALSADGTWLVSAADTLVLFQRVNGVYQKVDEYASSVARDTMETIALSADGQTLVAGNYGGSVMLFAIQGGKLGTPKSWALPGGGYSHSVRITPDGSAFAAGGSQGNFYLFDVAQFQTTGQPTIAYQVASAGSIYGVAIASDASAFVGIANVAGGTGRAYYVQRQGNTGTLKWSYATLHNPNSVVLDLGKNLVAIADGHPDNTPGAFYVLDATTGTLLGQFGTSNMSWPIQIAAGGTAIAAGSDDSNIYYFPAPLAPSSAAAR